VFGSDDNLKFVSPSHIDNLSKPDKATAVQAAQY
jgi:hypothetical protein